jgi:hypothetical protein
MRSHWPKELQTVLAEATQTDKRTAGVFLDTLSDIAYKEIKKNGGLAWQAYGLEHLAKNIQGY